MKVSAPTLLPLLRTRAQGDILAWVFLHPEGAHSVAEIARATGVTDLTVLREVNRLVDADLVAQVRKGRSRVIAPNPDNPATRPLAELLAVTFGPIPVLRDVLAGIDGIQDAWIYGSWAERYEGTPGRTPGDIDVVVVGNSDEDELEQAGKEAGQRVGREVHIQRVRPERWKAADSGFLRTIQGRPLVRVAGADDAD